jgi:lysophospholipase L1-like esterase
LFAPIASGVRISGEAAAASFAARSCAGNEPGVILPAGNVAINGARTSQALFATPETPDFYQRLYADVLPSGATQLSAAIAQHPTLVSVEFGANEVLGARDGGFALGQTVVPIAVWAPQYHQLLDEVGRASQRAVLVGLIDHAIDFPSFRTGAELWAARGSFAPFNVVVSDDCNGSQNVLFVPVVVPTAAARGAYYGANFHVPYTLSCADAGLAPDGTVIPDNILSPADMKRLDLQMAAMNAIIRLEAFRRGYAYFPLGALYDHVNVKAPFNAITLMTSPEPYGPYFSLDGTHPSAAGNSVLAAAAARALNERYHLGIPELALLATR